MPLSVNSFSLMCTHYFAVRESLSFTITLVVNLGNMNAIIIIIDTHWAPFTALLL